MLSKAKRMRRRKPKIVSIGGGTGSYQLLSGLKKYPVEISAIVTMTDSGGSSGRLRDEFGILPPGDVRRALLALSCLPLDKVSLRQLFEYRFNNGQGLIGHSFGNLFLTALTEIIGREDLAIAEAAKILDVKGRVLPVSLTNTHLCARLEDGTVIKGETNIDIRRIRPDLRILDVFLDPPAKIFPEAKKAICRADLIILGPGDLYGSLVCNLLVEGVNQAIAQSKASLLYICNLMTKYGETNSFAVSDFVKEVRRYLGQANKKLTTVLVNKSKKIPPKLLKRYEEEKSFLVKIDKTNCARLGIDLISKPLVFAGQLFRHDPDRLAKEVMALL